MLKSSDYICAAGTRQFPPKACKFLFRAAGILHHADRTADQHGKREGDGIAVSKARVRCCSEQVRENLCHLLQHLPHFYRQVEFRYDPVERPKRLGLRGLGIEPGRGETFGNRADVLPSKALGGTQHETGDGFELLLDHGE